MVLGHLLVNDRNVRISSMRLLTVKALLSTITSWPAVIYDTRTVMSAVQGELEATQGDSTLLECMGELWDHSSDH